MFFFENFRPAIKETFDLVFDRPLVSSLTLLATFAITHYKEGAHGLKKAWNDFWKTALAATAVFTLLYLAEALAVVPSKRFESARTDLTTAANQIKKLREDLNTLTNRFSVELKLTSFASEWMLEPRGEVFTTPCAMIAVSIINRGAPSIAENFVVTAKVPNKQTAYGERLVIQRNKQWIWSENGANVVLVPNDLIEVKTASEPIPSGGRQLGYILARFNNLSYSELTDERTSLSVACSDINGVDYVATVHMRRENLVVAKEGEIRTPAGFVVTQMLDSELQKTNRNK